MKKIKTIIGALAATGALSAAAVAASGCEQILDTMANSPIFYTPDVMYNGQEFQITRLATCKYEWKTDNDALHIEKRTVGSDPEVAFCTASVTSPATVTLTATNPDKADEPPVERKVEVRPWNLAVYSQDGKQKLGHTLNTNTVYLIRMVSGNSPVEGDIMKNKTDKWALEWARIGVAAATGLGEPPAHSFYIKTGSRTVNAAITATLNGTTESLEVEVVAADL